jgi:hypothetical protein
MKTCPFRSMEIEPYKQICVIVITKTQSVYQPVE